MGLSYGCNLTADELFAKRHKITEICIGTMETKYIIMPLPKSDLRIVLSNVHGDCTACTAHLEYLQLNEVNKVFTIIQEYISINARISCLFTIKKNLSAVQEWIKELKKFSIAGLHIQKSNREPTSDMYMITGILKVPNPIINTYKTFNTTYPTNHNNNDITKLNSINSSLNLETF
jgi:hypothetical protein